MSCISKGQYGCTVFIYRNDVWVDANAGAGGGDSGGTSVAVTVSTKSAAVAEGVGRWR